MYLIDFSYLAYYYHVIETEWQASNVAEEYFFKTKSTSSHSLSSASSESKHNIDGVFVEMGILQRQIL